MNSCASPLERIGPSAMTLSVVIATRDRPRELHGTVFSLLGQTRAANELIVIDQSIESGGRRAVERAPRALRDPAELALHRRDQRRIALVPPAATANARRASVAGR